MYLLSVTIQLETFPKSRSIWTDAKNQIRHFSCFLVRFYFSQREQKQVLEYSRGLGLCAVRLHFMLYSGLPK